MCNRTPKTLAAKQTKPKNRNALQITLCRFRRSSRFVASWFHPDQRPPYWPWVCIKLATGRGHQHALYPARTWCTKIEGFPRNAVVERERHQNQHTRNDLQSVRLLGRPAFSQRLRNCCCTLHYIFTFVYRKSTYPWLESVLFFFRIFRAEQHQLVYALDLWPRPDDLYDLFPLQFMI